MGAVSGEVVRALLGHALHDAEGSIGSVLTVLSRALRSERAFVVLGHRAPGEDGLVAWRIARHLDWGDQPRGAPELVRQFVTDLGDPGGDPVVRACIRSEGVALERQLVCEEVWEASKVPVLMGELGVRDRIVAAIPYGQAARVHICFDRLVGQPSFDADDVAAYREAVPSLLELVRRIALHHGLGRDPLTPRQREVLRCLLSGLGEKQIASELGIAERSAHHHVTSIFRKMGVQSRAELMACWMEPYP